MKRAAVFLAALTTLTGCVSSGTYDKLQKQLDDTTRAMQGQIDQRDAQIAALKKTISQKESQIADLDNQITALKKQMADKVASLESDKSKLQDDLASMVKDRSRLKASVQDMRQALAELQQRKRQADARVAEFRHLLDRFKPLIDTGKLQVKIVDGRMVVQLATDVLFGSGSARLSKDGQDAITQVAQVLATMDGRKFQIEGHTDNVPIHTAKYKSNWELAAARAITVVKTMIDAGMKPGSVSAASFAQYEPAQPNDTPEGRAANRRIEIVLVPDLSSLPGFEELKQIGKEKPAAADTKDSGSKSTPPIPGRHR